ncbi:MAG TPA: DUF6010 family protein [Kofleriaceae bacterium]|nr:DUF6010 family protein [Kofleriaceae bacterium]
MHQPPLLHLADFIGPVVSALVFIAIMSRVREPARRTFNAIFLAGAAGVYLSGGLGPWELIFPAVIAVVAYRALRSYRYIGLGWFLHAGWDVVHHLYGQPIWPWMPTSSFGCLIFDAAIAIWFVAGAPSVIALGARAAAAPPVAAG